MDNVLSPVGVILKKYRDLDKIGLRKQAEFLGISPSYLCDIQYGRRNLTVDVFIKIYSKYKYKCSSNDFIQLGYTVFTEDVITRYRVRSNNKETFYAIKDYIYITTGKTI